ncbi:MAG TPA: LacI family DNA-binding transcriptional regulator [Acidimicrobiales bacterium]|nr:LacI family DNA-binding transcriptional regulator [Acidimicrobiales bacterium]
MRLIDVAARAGVSLGTASKALSGQGALRAETRTKVLEAAEELGFMPNALARSLLRGRSFTVGVIASDVVGRFSIPVMLGVEDALGGGRIAVFFCDGRGDPIREEHYLRSLLSRRVDGIIVAGGQTDPRPPIDTRLPVPVVYAWTPSTDPSDSSVVPDHEGGAYGAVCHLLQTGHRRVAHVTGPRHFRSVQLRSEGAARALADAGMALAGPGALHGDWSEAWGRQATAILLRSCPDLDAVFCGNDEIARGVADGLRDLGRRIPDDVALMGFDNWEIMSAKARVPISTVDMNLHEVGSVAARRLLHVMDGGAARGIEYLPCQVIARESTGLASHLRAAASPVADA